jgi:DNA (cytosine-5)-methyltransferase 1
MISFTDIFCGAGGSSTGLVEAGFELTLAANHWPRAIETHALNHPRAEHLCADVNNYDMRRLPSTDVLWASPICTENTPAGGNPGKRSRKTDGQISIEAFGHVAQAGFERTRATFHDVIRATEVHRYKAVIVENVADIVWRWELLDWWCQGMIRLGYTMRIVCASSAHLGGVGNDPAAQWRNRWYAVFVRIGIPLPDLAVRPTAWCPQCEADVSAVQTWKPGAPRLLGQPCGKYRTQYTFTCPRGHATVEPYVLPAASLIDWSDLGVPIGERAEHGLPPLADATMAKVRDGLAMLREAALITVNHTEHDGRPAPLSTSPLPARTVRIGEGIATHPLLVPCGGSRYTDAADAADPFRPRQTRESEAVLTPPAFIATLRNNVKPHTPDRPVHTVTGGGNHHALVIPYRRGRAKTTAEPLHTLATRESAALVEPDIRIEDCRLRMLHPREQLSAQRFPITYVVLGNVGEQTMQAGNAVSVNAAHWIGKRVAAVL